MRCERSGGALTMSPREARPSLRRGPEDRAHDRVRGAEALEIGWRQGRGGEFRIGACEVCAGQRGLEAKFSLTLS